MTVITRFVVSIVVVECLFSVLLPVAYSGQDPAERDPSRFGWRFEVLPLDEIVIGFPQPIALQFTNVSEYPNWVPSFDPIFGADGVDVEIKFSVEKREMLRISDFPSGYSHAGSQKPTKARVDPGETTTMWMNLASVITSSTAASNQSSKHPTETGCMSKMRVLKPGQYRISVYVSGVGEAATLDNVVIREPTVNETEILQRISTISPNPNWLPDLVLSESFLFESNELPVSTKRILRLVEILRDTRTSPRDAIRRLSDLGSGHMDWGNLDKLVQEIQYECALAGGDVEAARNARRVIQQRFGDNTILRRIDNGNGLLASNGILADN